MEDVLESAFARIHAMEAELKRLEGQMAGGDGDPALLRRYGELSASFEGMGGYSTKTELNKVCAGLSIPLDMRARRFDSLWRRKDASEPGTPHFGRYRHPGAGRADEPPRPARYRMAGEYISHFKGTVLTISHDRYFLDRTVSRSDRTAGREGRILPGNYSFYAVEKEKRYEERLRQYEKKSGQNRTAQRGGGEKMRLWAFQGNDKMYRRAIVMERRIENSTQWKDPTGSET